MKKYISLIIALSAFLFSAQNNFIEKNQIIALMLQTVAEHLELEIMVWFVKMKVGLIIQIWKTISILQ